MQIILAAQCKSLTGALSKKNPYYLRRAKRGIFSARSNRKVVCPNDHWNFIRECAEAAKVGVPIANIWVSRHELYDALCDAGIDAGRFKMPPVLNANDIINIIKSLEQ